MKTGDSNFEDRLKEKKRLQDDHYLERVILEEVIKYKKGILNLSKQEAIQKEFQLNKSITAVKKYLDALKKLKPRGIQFFNYSLRKNLSKSEFSDLLDKYIDAQLAVQDKQNKVFSGGKGRSKEDTARLKETYLRLHREHIQTLDNIDKGMEDISDYMDWLEEKLRQLEVPEELSTTASKPSRKSVAPPRQPVRPSISTKPDTNVISSQNRQSFAIILYALESAYFETSLDELPSGKILRMRELIDDFRDNRGGKFEEHLARIINEVKVLNDKITQFEANPKNKNKIPKNVQLALTEAVDELQKMQNNKSTLIQLKILVSSKATESLRKQQKQLYDEGRNYFVDLASKPPMKPHTKRELSSAEIAEINRQVKVLAEIPQICSRLEKLSSNMQNIFNKPMDEFPSKPKPKTSYLSQLFSKKPKQANAPTKFKVLPREVMEFFRLENQYNKFYKQFEQELKSGKMDRNRASPFLYSHEYENFINLKATLAKTKRAIYTQYPHLNPAYDPNYEKHTELSPPSPKGKRPPS